MDSLELNSFSDCVSRELFERILPFWCGPALDREQGGWMGWLSNGLRPDRSQPKGLIVNTRILWAFSAVHLARPDPLYRQMAQRAFDYVMKHFWDDRHGGGFWRVDDRGAVTDDSKKIYGQAFCIYALTEYHRAFGEPEALARAQEVFGLIERHAHDSRFGGYIEVCRRDWSEAGPDARLSERDLNERKSMNNHLHVLEAYSNLHRVRPDRLVADRLRELMELFLNRILDTRTYHFNHFFDDQWRVRSDSYTFGHDIEGTWLLCEAAHELGDAVLLERVNAAALRMAETVHREAAAEDGGIYYEGRAGKIIDHGRECWPQAEALVGFLNAFQLSQDEAYFKAAQSIWVFIESRLADRVNGEWFWRIDEAGQPDPNLPKVSEWKGPYHGTRACLETLRRIKEIRILKHHLVNA
jgi:mannobiose 2-epimerase